MTHGDFPRPRNRAAADQARVADCVMRRAKRPRAHKPARIFEQARYAVDAGRLDGLFERHRRQNGRNPTREHCLARTWRTDQQEVMATGAGHFQSALRGHLPAHVAQIDRILAGLGQHLRSVHGYRLEGFRRVDDVGGFRQRLRRKDFYFAHHRRFTGIRRGNHELFYTFVAGGQRRRKGSAHGSHAAVERKLSEENVIVEVFPKECALAAEDAERHRQVETGTFFANVGRGEIDGHGLVRGKLEAAIAQRGFDALAALFDGRIGQAYDVELTGLPRAYIGLDLDQVRVDAKHCGADCLEEHVSHRAEDAGRGPGRRG